MMHILQRYTILFSHVTIVLANLPEFLADNSATLANGKKEMRTFLDGLHLRISASQVCIT